MLEYGFYVAFSFFFNILSFRFSSKLFWPAGADAGERHSSGIVIPDALQ
jgi:hypothetical protein